MRCCGAEIDVLAALSWDFCAQTLVWAQGRRGAVAQTEGDRVRGRGDRGGREVGSAVAGCRGARVRLQAAFGDCVLDAV